MSHKLAQSAGLVSNQLRFTTMDEDKKIDEAEVVAPEVTADDAVAPEVETTDEAAA